MRAAESRLGSVTGGNGSIYAVRRADYVEVDPRFGHDLSLPYLMVQRGRRAVYEPGALAFEKPTPTNETEYRRKVRMFEHCWLIVLRGRMLRRLGPLLLARDRLAPPPALRARAPPPRAARDLARARDAAAGSTTSCSPRSSCCSPPRPSASGSRATTCSSTWATVVALRNYLRRGVPATWEVGGGHALNRALDVAIAGAGLVVASPVLAVAALAVKLEDGGPVLYRQTRVGKDGVDFELLKLRTMVVGAEKHGRGLRGRTRATRGSRGRAASCGGSRIDELPQLWNVVRGDMSVIGPRPTLRYQVDALRRAAAAPARREAGDHRLGADPRPRGAARGPSGSSSTSGTSSTARRGST